VKRLATLLAISGSLLLLPTAALAKGNVAARGYAVITGPRLVHPIVLTAPWNRSRGGYYGNEAEVFLHLAESSGAIPAGRDLLPQGGSVPDGVVPLRSGPSPASLGPVYRLTWFRNGLTDVVTQKGLHIRQRGPHRVHAARLPSGVDHALRPVPGPRAPFDRMGHDDRAR